MTRNAKPVLAIDARLYGNRSWAGRIATATVNRFVRDYADSFSKIVLIAHSKKVFDALPSGDRVSKSLIRGHFLFWKLFLVPFVLRAHSVDVYFSPTSELPIWKFGKTKYVNMVHDLFMEEILDETVGKERWLFVALNHFMRTKRFLESYYLAWFFRTAFTISDEIVAISEFSLKQASDRYLIPSNKFKVLHIGADDLFFEKYDKDAVLGGVNEKFGFSWKYVFSYDAMVDYSKLTDTVIRLCESAWLHWVILNRHPEIYEMFSRCPYANEVTFIRDFISDEDLVSLIRGSEFVFFPSVWEGFWIPIAESMASWKIVVAPGTTAIPEVGWEFALCYDPASSDDLAAIFSRAIETYASVGDVSETEFVRHYGWGVFCQWLSRILLSQFLPIRLN